MLFLLTKLPQGGRNLQLCDGREIVKRLGEEGMTMLRPEAKQVTALDRS